MPVFSERDGSRTEAGKQYALVKRHTRPADDQGGWFAITRDLLESAAYRTLSTNARRVFDRLLIEHISHGRCLNGQLAVTHGQFIEYGVTPDYVADAQEELEFKGLVRIKRGRAGHGTTYPNVFRLTCDGDHEGAKATNEWRRFTLADARQWTETVRHERAEKRMGSGRKKKIPTKEFPNTAAWGSPNTDRFREAG